VEANLCGGVLTGEIDARDLAPLRPDQCYLKAHERVLTVAIELASENAAVDATTVSEDTVPIYPTA
jgi:replicative DNA helicase